MQARVIDPGSIRPDPQPVLISVGVMGAVLFTGLVLLALNSGISESFPYFFLIPWVAALAVVLLIPSAVLWYQGKFSFDNPIVFATFSYFFPAFVLGGFALAAGLSQPPFLSNIQDAPTNLPFTVQLIMMGFAGLAVGYFLPIGKKIGEISSRFFLKRAYSDDSYLMPGLVLLGIGMLNSALSLSFGLFGFQQATEYGTYDGVLFLATLFWLEASFLLWYVVFRRHDFNTKSYITIAILVVTSVAKALFAGNRSSLLQVFFVVLLAYVLSGRKFKARQYALATGLLLVALFVGMIWGTTFRAVKGSEDRVGASEYTESVFNTIDKLGNDNGNSLLGSSFTAFAERIDTLSSVAVVVSNYEQLAPFEESYGLDNNIIRDLETFLIPRIIWNDRPRASEPRKYSELYFNYAENSFAITPIADLLRNFGVIGVPLGMLILGIILRSIYRALVEDQPRGVWRATLYFMSLTAVSYEGFYGAIIPFMFKVGVTAIIGLTIVSVLAKIFDGRRLASAS